MGQPVTLVIPGASEASEPGMTREDNAARASITLTPSAP